jgi:hypothetical protein
MFRHCERSEAIQEFFSGKTLDCFGATRLAMTLARHLSERLGASG